MTDYPIGEMKDIDRDIYLHERDLMTEAELIEYLRIPDVSEAKNYHNVIENLKRMRDLPCFHICNKVLYPRKAVQEWVERETNKR